MNRPENYLSVEWFVKNVFIELPSKYRFIIMGGKPVDSIRKLESNRIIVTGFLEECEVKRYFENSFCMVAPLLYGSGIKTKILSSLNAGLPVLTNSIGIEGINAHDKKEYLHCEKGRA